MRRARLLRALATLVFAVVLTPIAGAAPEDPEAREPATVRLAARPTRRQFGERVRNLVVSPDGGYVAAVGVLRATIWSAHSEKPHRTVETSKDCGFRNASICGLPPHFVAEESPLGDVAPHVVVWDIGARQLVRTIQSKPGGDGVEDGFVAILGEVPALHALVLRWRGYGTLLFDPVAGAPLANPATPKLTFGSRTFESHLNRHPWSVHASADGRFLTDGEGCVVEWPSLDAVWKPADAALPPALRGKITFWGESRFLTDPAYMVRQVHVRRDGEGLEAVLCVDRSRDGVQVVWHQLGATLVDATAHGRDQVLLLDGGILRLVDGRTGRERRKLSAPGDGFQTARFIPGNAYAWVVRGEKGVIDAITLPEPPAPDAKK